MHTAAFGSGGRAHALCMARADVGLRILGVQVA
jgi:hypothetical protein